MTCRNAPVTGMSEEVRSGHVALSNARGMIRGVDSQGTAACPGHLGRLPEVANEWWNRSGALSLRCCTQTIPVAGWRSAAGRLRSCSSPATCTASRPARGRSMENTNGTYQWAPALRGLAYEELIADLIQEIVMGVDWEPIHTEAMLYHPSVESGSSVFDLTIEVDNNRFLLIKIQAGIKLSTIDAIANGVKSFRAQTARQPAVLLVTRLSLTSAGRSMLAEIPHASHVVIQGVRGQKKKLSDAINRALATLDE